MIFSSKNSLKLLPLPWTEKLISQKGLNTYFLKNTYKMLSLMITLAKSSESGIKV